MSRDDVRGHFPYDSYPHPTDHEHPMTAPTPRDVLTRDNARDYGEFGLFTKVGQTLISLFTVPPGVSYQTPEGLRAEDEETRIAFDIQGGVYPIRESVFHRSYAEAALTRREPLDVPSVDELRHAMQMALPGYQWSDVHLERIRADLRRAARARLEAER